jgi:hypothetical protein
MPHETGPGYAQMRSSNPVLKIIAARNEALDRSSSVTTCSRSLFSDTAIYLLKLEIGRLWRQLGSMRMAGRTDQYRFCPCKPKFDRQNLERLIASNTKIRRALIVIDPEGSASSRFHSMPHCLILHHLEFNIQPLPRL